MNTEIVVASISGIVTIVVGVISALAAYKGSIKGAQNQIEKANKDSENAKKEEDKLSRRFIESFLYDEIYTNLEIIQSSVINAFKEQAENTLIGGYNLGKYDFKFDTYNEIRYQLNKINSLEYVADIMSVYKCFRRINQVEKIHDLTEEEALTIYNILIKWDTKLSVKHFK
ncbi:hypothetical protein [Mesobacillus jeotgali]|uniref:hypothetical protein n=1 Tax=Mesobacillus jeotgali TaxID=129985 RepID=UPI001CFED678|nr:hypothetical protein [Mesobacillus jeotgali]